MIKQHIEVIFSVSAYRRLFCSCVLFAFVFLGLVSSVLFQEIGWEERLQHDMFCDPSHCAVGLLCVRERVCVCVAYLFLNFFSFYQAIRLLSRKTVIKYLYLHLHLSGT